MQEAALERSNKSLEDSNNLLEGKHMQPVASEMRSIVMEAAWPPVPGESVGAVIQRAARRLELGYARVRSYYYGLVRMVPAEEADRLRVVQRQMMAERLARLDAEAALIRAQLGAGP